MSSECIPVMSMSMTKSKSLIFSNYFEKFLRSFPMAKIVLIFKKKPIMFKWLQKTSDKHRYQYICELYRRRPLKVILDDLHAFVNFLICMWCEDKNPWKLNSGFWRKCVLFISKKMYYNWLNCITSTHIWKHY